MMLKTYIHDQREPYHLALGSKPGDPRRLRVCLLLPSGYNQNFGVHAEPHNGCIPLLRQASRAQCCGFALIFFHPIPVPVGQGGPLLGRVPSGETT